MFTSNADRKSDGVDAKVDERLTKGSQSFAEPRQPVGIRISMGRVRCARRMLREQDKDIRLPSRPRPKMLKGTGSIIGGTAASLDFSWKGTAHLSLPKPLQDHGECVFIAEAPSP